MGLRVPGAPLGRLLEGGGRGGQVVEAMQAFTEVDERQPGYRMTNFYLARLNEKIGRRTEADKRMRMYEQQKARGEIRDGQS